MDQSASLESDELAYAEFGKIFLPVDATDYKELDRSAEQIARDLYSLYNKSLAKYTVEQKLAFTSREPGYGHYSAGLIKRPNYGDRYLFVQIQQRKECEPILRNGPAPKGANNRPYNHVRLTEIGAGRLQELLRRQADVYTSLLVRDGSTVQLRDYYLDKKKDPEGKTLPVVTGPVEAKFQTSADQPLDQETQAGLENMLYEKLGFPAQSGLKPGRLAPAIVLILPGLKDQVEKRLQLMQAASAWLLPATGVITFALDFFTDQRFQFFFTAEVPPEWLLNKPTLVGEGKLKEYAQNENGYYQQMRKLMKDVRLSPYLEKYLRRLPLTDAIQIASLLVLEDASLPADLPALLLRNFNQLDRDDILTLIRRALADPAMVKKILLDCQTSIADARFVPDFIYDVLQLAWEHKQADLPGYYGYRWLVRKLVQNLPKFQQQFTVAVQAAKPTSLDTEMESEPKAGLFSDLIAMGAPGKITFQDNAPILGEVFMRPGPALNAGINELRTWTPSMQVTLNNTMLDHPEIWKEERQAELHRATNLPLPTFIQVVEHFLHNEAQQQKFKALPAGQRAKLLKAILDRQPQGGKSLLADFPVELARELRGVCLQTCQPETKDNLRFAGWWLTKLSGEQDQVFKEDYLVLLTMCRTYRTARLLDLELAQDQNVEFLLTGQTIGGQPGSLVEACRSASLRVRYPDILVMWVGQKIPISSADIAELVDKLPASNEVLADLVAHSDSPEQTGQIYRLEAGKAQAWLAKTQDKALRSRYNDEKGDDLLYQHLCEIETPTPEFVRYALTVDLSAAPESLDWGAYTKRLKQNYDRFVERKAAEPITDLFVTATKYFTPQDGKDKVHRSGLLRLAERQLDKTQHMIAWDELELRRFIYYALKEKVDRIKIQNPAREILFQNRDILLSQLSIFRNETIWVLHLAFERIIQDKGKEDIALTEEIFQVLTRIGLEMKQALGNNIPAKWSGRVGPPPNSGTPGAGVQKQSSSASTGRSSEPPTRPSLAIRRLDPEEANQPSAAENTVANQGDKKQSSSFIDHKQPDSKAGFIPVLVDHPTAGSKHKDVGKLIIKRSNLGSQKYSETPSRGSDWLDVAIIVGVILVIVAFLIAIIQIVISYLHIIFY